MSDRGSLKRGVAVVAIASSMVLTPATPLAAQQGPDADVDEIVDALFGDLNLDGTPNPIADPEGDGADRAGNATPTPDGTDIRAADWFEIDGTVGEDELADLCVDGIDTSAGHVEAVCPDTFDDLAAASRFLMITTEFTGPVTAENLVQFAFLWAEPGVPTYLGAANDYNNDETDSIDVFRFSLTEPWQLGRTTYRDGSFGFAATTAAMMLMGAGYLVLLIPSGTVQAECLNLAVAAVAGNSIDKATLPETTSGTFGETVAVETTTTTSTTTSTTTTTLATTDDPSALDDPEAGETSAQDDAPSSGGVNPLLWIAIIVIVLGGVGFFLLTRRKKECEQELAELNAARARLSASEGRLTQARRRLASDPDSTALGVEVAEAEATVERDRQSVEDWEYAYNLCLGLVEPRGAGISDVPETPSSRPTTVIDDPMAQPVVEAEPPTTSTDEPSHPTTDGTDVATGVIAATEHATAPDDPCGGKKYDWIRDEQVSDIWLEPVGTIEITMDRAPEQFLDWLQRNQETPDPERAADSDRVHASIPLERADDLLDVATARDLLRTANPRYRVELSVRVELQMVGKSCEREWVCEDGNWSKTGRTRLTQKAFVSEADPYYFAEVCESGTQVVTKLNTAMRRARHYRTEAGKAEQRLRDKCAGT